VGGGGRGGWKTTVQHPKQTSEDLQRSRSAPKGRRLRGKHPPAFGTLAPQNAGGTQLLAVTRRNNLSTFVRPVHPLYTPLCGVNGLRTLIARRCEGGTRVPMSDVPKSPFWGGHSDVSNSDAAWGQVQLHPSSGAGACLRYLVHGSCLPEFVQRRLAVYESFTICVYSLFGGPMWLQQA